MFRKLLLASLLMSWTVFNAGITQAAPPPNTTNPNPTSAPKKPRTSVGTQAIPIVVPQTYFAVVRDNGSLARGLEVTSSKSLGTGFYEVIFKQNITACAFVATIGRPDFSGVESTGQITVVGRAGTNNGVFISTTDSSGNLANRNFHLVVTC